MARLRWAGNQAAEREHLEALTANPPRKKQKAKRQKSRKGRKSRRDQPPPNPLPCSYPVYLLSAWWRWRRRKKFGSARGKCERCGRRAEQVHHKHYRSLGSEKDADLEAICKKCHEAEHESLIQADRHLRAIAAEQ